MLAFWHSTLTAAQAELSSSFDVDTHPHITRNLNPLAILKQRLHESYPVSPDIDF